MQPFAIGLQHSPPENGVLNGHITRFARRHHPNRDLIGSLHKNIGVARGIQRAFAKDCASIKVAMTKAPTFVVGANKVDLAIHQHVHLVRQVIWCGNDVAAFKMLDADDFVECRVFLPQVRSRLGLNCCAFPLLAAALLCDGVCVVVWTKLNG